jgi:phospholipase A2
MDHNNNKHQDQIASVQYNQGISIGEKEFLNYRLPIVKKAIEEKFKHPITKEQIPSIAIISSGGGYRAMLYFAALLARADTAHILDTITYISALSGSTWALAPWITTGKPIAEFKTYIQQCAAKHFCDITHKEKKFIADKVITKKLHNQKLTLIDIYGELLGNRLLECLGDSKYTAVLSDQIDHIKNGSYPYPICIAIDGRNEKEAIKNPTVYEYTPHTISEHTNHTEIPSWGDGRKYNHDKSTNSTLEKNLAYDLGTWGSAFGASIHDILKNLFNDYPELLKIIEKMLEFIDTQKKWGDALYAKL